MFVAKPLSTFKSYKEDLNQNANVDTTCDLLAEEFFPQFYSTFSSFFSYKVPIPNTNESLVTACYSQRRYDDMRKQLSNSSVQSNAVNGVKRVADIPAGAGQPCKLTLKNMQCMNQSLLWRGVWDR